MFLIVYGHVVGDPFNPFNQITQPAYTKQLGVAFFVFITGWSLANDNRNGLRVVFNRLFAIYFYGILFALLFLNEIPSLRTIAGGCIILVSQLLIFIKYFSLDQ